MPAEILRLAGGSLPEEVLARVAAAAKATKVVAFPTDTVYGLGSTGLIKAAVRRLYQIKGRASIKPLPILVPSLEAARRWVQFTPQAEALARAFWPGALTLVLKTTQDGRLLTFPEFQTLAIRAPKHPLLLRLLELSGVPWASTSANLSGRPALADGAATAEAFRDLADFVIDAGPAPGTESTIVDATSIPARVLRPGMISAEDITKAAAGIAA